MTICDKIQTVGETLESNLNARGVSCTFGTGTGEKNILQMTNLITSSNLKGSADSIIRIIASRPYLLSGEKTDLIVTLHNGVGTPLANKSVTISDGTSVYNGITNSQGIFTLPDISVSSDTTFTATYGTVSATCLVEYCTFVDYAVTSNHNDSWDGLTYMSRGTDGTTINNTGSGTLFERIKINNSTYPFSNGDFTVTVNILSVTGSDNRLRVLGATTCSGEPYAQVDYTLCGNLNFNFRIPTGNSIKYKDLRVKAL